MQQNRKTSGKLAKRLALLEGRRNTRNSSSNQYRIEIHGDTVLIVAMTTLYDGRKCLLLVSAGSFDTVWQFHLDLARSLYTGPTLLFAVW